MTLSGSQLTDTSQTMKPGDKVLKNPEKWRVTEFDAWGRGVGVGEVLAVEPDIDVWWPGGRCFEDDDQLLPLRLPDGSFPEYALRAAHRFSSHRGHIQRSTINGCFYCLNTDVTYDTIDDWQGRHSEVAMCPHCHIDSVLPGCSGFPVQDQTFLLAMQALWFGRIRLADGTDAGPEATAKWQAKLPKPK